MAGSRRQYPFHLIEPKWQQVWDKQQAFRAFNPGETVPDAHPFGVRHGLSGKVARAETLPAKFYILDMFPYPSGAGLHVGHPEGYTATDILARYRRARGFNVLHPMGWDSFGLPAEQYAVKTGQHPRKTTEANIANFTRQIKSLGFSYDWSREFATTDPDYFKWTQWIFLKLYNSWFNPETNKAESINSLQPLVRDIVGLVKAEKPQPTRPTFSSELIWYAYELKKQGFDILRIEQSLIDSLRLTYVSEAPVNWCPELGTVLANEEVINGKSEVGGFDVIRKPMRQWMLRITAYAERLLTDLETIDWSDSLKEMQRNWIGRSEGATVKFRVSPGDLLIPDIFVISVFTTRPDTLFGATYLVLAPEHPILEYFTRSPYISDVKRYQQEVARKSDLERTELSKIKTGVFTGVYAINPVNGEKIPIWIADYVLASYGTGAIMAVPAHDTRDFEFAKKFGLNIRKVVRPAEEDICSIAKKGFHNQGLSSHENALLETYIENSNQHDADASEPFCHLGISFHSSNEEISLNGLYSDDAKQKITSWLESKKLGKKTINYKLRDWLFSRQRYWGEPFPIIWKKDTAGNLYHEALPESALPLLPPSLEDYKPTPDGQPPLARAKDWVSLPDGSVRETNTMPQWAGSCWYYLRYLDAKNTDTFVGKDVEHYWMGSRGRESAPNKNNAPTNVGGYEPQGVDLYVGGTEHAVLHLLYARFWHKVLFDLGYVSTAEPFFKLVNQGLILGDDGQKMSKARGNVVNPDDVIKEFGADAFRLYEMFMGPLQDTKPWNTRGVEGVYRFLGRVWRLFVDENSETAFEQAETTAPAPDVELLEHILLDGGIQDQSATPAQLKTLHACIKKVTEDLDAMRFNTAISAMMVFVNEAITWQTKPLSVMKTFLQLLAPFSPHLAEELWAKLHQSFGQLAPSLPYGVWPTFDPALLVESEIELPVQVNGKLRDVIKVAVDADNATIEATALASEKVQQFIGGKPIKKVVIVPKRMVNIIAP